VSVLFAQTYHEDCKEDLRSFFRQGSNFENLWLSESDTLFWDTSDVWIQKLTSAYILTWRFDSTYKERLYIIGFSERNLDGTLQFRSPKLITLNCENNNLLSLDVSNNTALEYLDCGLNNLMELDISHNINLEEVYCQHNNISLLDIWNNTLLSGIWCYNNNLSVLDVSNNLKLRVIDCANNNLSVLDVSNNTELYDFVCEGNNLSVLDVSNNDILENLQCSNNNLLSLDVSNNLELRILNCGDNNLSSLDVSNNTMLEKFNCGDNNLSVLDVSNNTELFIFGCARNNISELNISNGMELEYLECYDNRLKFSTLPILTAVKEELYIYFPQKVIVGGIKLHTDTVDLSSEYNINGHITNYSWYDITDGEEVEISLPTYNNGIFSFTEAYADKKLRCKMTNGQFPLLTLLYETEVIVSVLDTTIVTGLVVYPNPNYTEALITFMILESSSVIFEICDITGNIIYSVSDYYGSGEHTILLSTSDYLGGTYICRMLINGKQVGLKSFIVVKLN